MNRSHAKSLFAALLLGGCASAFNGPDQTLSVEKAHPIAVDSQVVTLTVNATQNEEALTSLDQARLRAFADAYLRSGHGPITVTSPTTAGGVDAERVAGSVRAYLHGLGVPHAAIGGATYRGSTERADDLVLSYTHYVATPSPCGLWEGIMEADRRNLRTPNFGCATQNNLAAVIADPRDLVTAAGMAAADAPARIRAVNAFRDGQVSAVETDEEIEASVAE
ncbi:MAG: CpaD family pilus assembly protein [Pseudomonadota bacterium]